MTRSQWGSITLAGCLFAGLFGCTGDTRDLGGGRQTAGRGDGGAQDAPDAGQRLDLLPHATVGARCSGSGRAPFILLSGVGTDCGAHARILASGSDGTPAVFARLPENPSGALEVEATVCLTTGECELHPLRLTIDAFQEQSGAQGTWALDLPDIAAGGRFQAGWCEYDSHLSSSDARAAGISVRDVAIYQGVKVAVATNRAAVTRRNAPVVEGRPGRLRVFLRPEAGWTVREILTRLRLEPPGRDPEVLEHRMTVRVASNDASGTSTPVFDIPARLMVPGLRYAVSLHETAGCGVPAAEAPEAAFPASGTEALDPRPTGGALQIVLVPVRYNADGSRRLPDTSPPQVARFRNLLYAMYPVSDVEITVREPFDWNNTIAPNGAGWSEILQAILMLRARDRPSPRTYYYGVFAPASTYGTFCNRGCVAGLGPLPGAQDQFARGAVGLGYSGQSAAETFTHEIGHTMGRQHAPCGVRDADPSYPYGGGTLGSWGFDILSSNYKAPSSFTDFMGYCDPSWISDYTFRSIYDRIRAVHLGSALLADVPGRWRVLLDDGESLRWGEETELDMEPKGEPILADVLDRAGQRVEIVEVIRYALDHLEGALLMVPELPSEAAALRLADGRIAPL